MTDALIFVTPLLGAGVDRLRRPHSIDVGIGLPARKSSDRRYSSTFDLIRRIVVSAIDRCS
ncbi:MULTISPECIES: hypothetical protein [unclassified Bradyrhizobium]